jgi:enoyl-CoA hydratase
LLNLPTFQLKKAFIIAQGQDILFNFVENLKSLLLPPLMDLHFGGLELAMACHFRIASDNAKWAYQKSLGVIQDMEERNVCQLIGKGRAMEMIMTAGMVTADDAYRMD